jgi:hypothetical protein
VEASGALGFLSDNADAAASIRNAGAIHLLVQLLGCGSADVERNAAGALSSLGRHPANRDAISSAGAIPALVQMLMSESPEPTNYPRVENACLVLGELASSSASAVAIAAAGAIPLLVHLLGIPGSPAAVQKNVADLLGELVRNADNAVTSVVAGAIIPRLVQLVGHGTSTQVQESAALTLYDLAEHGHAVTVAAAGAIPPLARMLSSGSSSHGKLLGPASSPDVRKIAAGLMMMCILVPENKVTIADAGAIPLLVQLLGPGCDDDTKTAVSHTLGVLGDDSAANRAAIAAALDSLNAALKAMHDLGI